MDLSYLFASTDNLYKFLFIGGIALIALSILYPLQQQQLIDIEINSHNKETSLLNNDILQLNREVDGFKKTTKKTEEHLKELSASKPSGDDDAITTEMNKIKASHIKIMSEFKAKQRAVETKLVVLEFNEKKIKLLKAHRNEYAFYSRWLKWFGMFFTAIGLIFWARSTWVTDRIRDKELKSES